MKMNQNTKDIARMLNCSLDVALRVQDAIDDDNLIDWSEDSIEVINKIVVLVAKNLDIVSIKKLVFSK
jgi:hypothetical protein